eukprot:2855300-Pleurochrysis_carterae.AAC.1
MQSGLQQKLRVIEQIRVMLAGTAVSCPGIVVIGSQNAGKSSLLETISGISFPRGEGLCTRCPTVVSLEVDPHLEPHLILATDPGYNSNRRVLKLSSSQGEVRREIARLMAMMANTGAVTKDPVYIKVVREKGITLTMCDLPGITAMSSSQHDIEEQTVEMTEEWAANPNMIILCCVQAQDDFHNSKALKIALKYDPQGMRTLGIVTKVDMLPTKGDFASRLLMENHGDVRLEAHGFIAIRNQTKDEADRRVDAAYLQQAEKELFSKHGQLRVLPPDRWGVRTLVGKLQQLQMGQLDQAMPQLATDVKKQIAVAESTIARLPATAKTPQEQRFLLLDVVQNCSLRFQELITATDTNPDFEMHIAARSFDLISKFVQNVSEKVPSFLEDAQLEFISQQVAETRGVYLSNFLHGAVFRRIVKAAFEMPLMEEAKRLVEDLAATVKRCLATLLESATPDHPALCERLIMTAHDLADKERTRAQTLVSDKIAAEMTTPFTMNADYQRLLNEFEELLAADSSNSYISATPSASSSFSADFVRSATEDVRTKGAEAAMVRRLQVSLYAYQRVLQARLFDCIPMDVRNRIMYQLHDRLAPTLLSDEPNLLPLLADEKARPHACCHPRCHPRSHPRVLSVRVTHAGASYSCRRICRCKTHALRCL